MISVIYVCHFEEPIKRQYYRWFPPLVPPVGSVIWVRNKTGDNTLCYEILYHRFTYTHKGKLDTIYITMEKL